MLTDTKLRNLKAQDKLYKVPDRDGMYVAVTPAGGVSFRYNYSITGTKHSEYFVFNDLGSDRSQHSGARLPKKLVARRFDLFSR